MRPPADPAALLRLAARASVATASVLALGKLAAALSSGSVSLLASLVDSTMDIAASLLTFFALRWSQAPPDDEHRFGHGKAEPLATLAQAAFIAGSALFLLVRAAEALVNPAPLGDLGLGVGVLCASMAATAGLLLFQRAVIRRTNSPLIQADALHYASDLATNGASLLALLLANAGLLWADPLLGLLLALWILRSAAQIGRDAVALLMDAELPEATKARIRQIAWSEPGVLGVHDLKTRQSGPATFIQLHLELDDAQTLEQAHAKVESVERLLLAEFPAAEVIIHADPRSAVDPARVRPEPRPTEAPTESSSPGPS